MTLQKLMIILLLGWIPCSGQGTVTLSERTARKVLIELAELDMRRVDARFDSTTIVELTAAYFYKDSALHASRNEAALLTRNAQDAQAMYGLKDKDLQRAVKAIRKQKRLKWLAIAAVPAIAISVALAPIIAVPVAIIATSVVVILVISETVH